MTTNVVSPSDARAPRGTVAFAFTDIEGSTVRWERDRTAMDVAVRRHDALLHAAIVEHGGTVFKTVGDAFCAVFARSEDAVAAMRDAQRALAAEDFSAVDGIRVRAAIHAGTAHERDGDYYGPVVNRVARLLAIAHGGQVLLSGVATELVSSTLPDGISLRDLGEHRLKDLALPERVHQLVADDLPAAFPPLRSLDTLSNNLPLQMTSFVGRDAEVIAITALLATNRLVTVVGSGGIGKTRTTLQVAANLIDGTGDGVWFVELAPLASAEFVPSTIATALGLKLPTDGDAVEHLVRLLAGKQALLVFDNCEHVVEAAANVISSLVRGCARIAVLSSSRQPLGVAGEVVYRMPALAVPPHANDALSAAEALDFAAIALFVERARAVDSRFVLTDHDAPIVADICRRLDGIALAIELAAPRIKILNPRQLRDRLDERFRVLTGGSRDVLPRQQTLRALIDWSYDLLDERERALFRRLAIFVDGFTIEGAVAAGSGDDLDEFDVFDLLASLVDKSLVLAEPNDDAVRYHMLESTRAYGLERLDAAGERERTALRHLDYYRDAFVTLDERSEWSGVSTELDAAFARDLEDVRAALEVASRLRSDLGAELLEATTVRAWESLGLDGELRRRLEASIAALAGDAHRRRVRLQCSLAGLEQTDGRTARSLDIATRAVRDARTDDVSTLARALLCYGGALTSLERFDEAEAALVEATAISNQSARARGRLQNGMAILAIRRGDFATAVTILETRLVAVEALGDEGSIIMTATNLAELYHQVGETERAIALIEARLPLLRKNVDSISLLNFAAYLVAIRADARARDTAREVIRNLLVSMPSSPFIALASETIALTFVREGSVERAAALAGYADATLRAVEFERQGTERGTFEHLRTELAERLAADELARQLELGATLTSDAAIELALADRS